ncbi:HNH endonuclease [Schaalia sp. ZJ405]|uniref:HNH endonuclease n=1 Tax=Schaalia sp. ZJ405 TaxID=2709403 RepID=UPI0013ED7CCE|nr:HNH endonuclease [Schaalia sp. ZJ405]
MATSRTGTTKWLHIAKQARHQAQTNGQTHCPICHTPLDYTHGRTPNSAEVDHITPASLGGTDTLDNVRIICRLCNQRRGNGKKHKPPKHGNTKTRAPHVTRTTSTDTW